MPAEEDATINEVPIPPPFGSSLGPSYTTAELLARFVAGAREGSSSDAQIEEAVLVRGDEPLAIRLDGAMLIRDRVPEAMAALRATLCEVLAGLGMKLVEGDTPLALVVECEVFARRGYAWGLWARDLDQGRVALAARAAGEVPGILDDYDAQQQDQARIDAVLRMLEEDL